MKRIGLIFASRKGQTAKIVRYINRRLAEKFIETEIVDLGTPQNLNVPVDGLILGAPVYAGNYPKVLVRWARDNRQLFGLPAAFFSVTLNAADKRPEARVADRQLLRTFIDKTGCQPQYLASFAGALKYRDYNWLLKLWMRRIAAKAGGDTDTSRNYEYTDWKAVDEFLEAFTNQSKNAAFFAGVQFPQPKAKADWIDLSQGYSEEKRA